MVSSEQVDLLVVARLLYKIVSCDHIINIIANINCSKINVSELIELTFARWRMCSSTSAVAQLEAL